MFNAEHQEALEQAGYGKPDEDKEVKLFRAVILQAIRDAAGIQSERVGPLQAERIKREACEWFLNADDDFQYVCHQAGCDPQTTQQIALEFLTDPTLKYKDVMRIRTCPY